MAKVVKSKREVIDVDQELEKLTSKKKNGNNSAKKESSNKDTSSKKVDKNKSNKDKNKKGSKKAKKGIFNYFHEVKSEVSKVKWPSKKEMIKYSTATVCFILFFSLFFYIIDVIFVLLKTGV